MLSLGTANRIARVVDRRIVSAEIARLAGDDRPRGVYRRQLERLKVRAQLLLRGVGHRRHHRPRVGCMLMVRETRLAVRNLDYAAELAGLPAPR